MPIINSVSTTAYSRLQQELALKINAGYWKPGEQLPPERELARKHGISVGTVRKAMEQLVHAGYCYRVQGKGTFVTDYPTDQPIFYRIRSSFADKDALLIPHNVTRTECPASEEIAAALNIPVESSCISITRCLNGRDGNGIFPIGWSASYFARPLCHALMQTPMSDFQKHSLYYLAERDCHLPSFFCDEIIYVRTTLPSEIYNQLNLKTHFPCLELHMVSYTYGKIPFEFRLSYVLGGSKGIMRKHDFRL